MTEPHSRRSSNAGSDASLAFASLFSKKNESFSFADGHAGAASSVQIVF
jgi:hypothetical protein